MQSSANRSPLKAAPLRIPGQSVEEEREKLISDVVEQWGLQAVIFILLAGFEWWRWYVDMKPRPWLFTGAAALMTALAAWRIWRVIPRLRNLRQARDGERVVGQFLERLREDGYQVFHDVVGNGFNIDHLIVGPTGVYTIETKTWSKPVKGRPEIVFDGERVLAGTQSPERDPVIQAKAQAGWIRALIQESAGKKAFVRPVVVFPGWFISASPGALRDIWVLEPKALPAFLSNEPRRLSEEDVKLFSFHISRSIRASQKS